MDMASSSSPSSPEKKYDVFISFRKMDTRRTFASHLCAALRKKTDTYMDDRIGKGEVLWPALERAIEDSSLYIVILSENYASSPWCLRELTKILECSENQEERVMPVFYMVEPSDVRKQSGSYQKASDEYEGNINISQQELLQWRKALTYASNLAGWSTSGFKDDAKLLEEIVEVVISRLDKMFRSKPDLTKYFGIDEKIRSVELLLNKTPLQDVRFIGICGEGGMGKTTLAKAIYRKRCWEYEGYCFLRNVRGESNKSGKYLLKEKLVSTLLGDKDGSSGASELAQTKILAVLDEVNDIEQIENLVEGRHCFGAGSRILVIARDLHILSQKVDDVYMVEELNPKEASRLFCRNAFKKNCPDVEFKELAENMVYYAAGNPLALTVLGSSLRDRSPEEWESKLDKLGKMFDQHIDVLKLSIASADPIQEINPGIVDTESAGPTNKQKVRHFPMAEPSFLVDLVKKALTVVGKGLQYKSTQEILESTTEDLGPLVEQIGQCIKEKDLQTEEIEKLKKVIAANQEVLHKNNLDEAYQSFRRYCAVQMGTQVAKDLKEILSKLSSDDSSLRSQSISAQGSKNIRTQTFKSNLEIFPEFTVGLDGPLMKELEFRLLYGTEQVLNLYGRAGSGKTTLAKKLCRDPQVIGKFNNNIFFETLGSQIRSNEAISQLRYLLPEFVSNPVLLVLDDVWPASTNVIEEFRVQMPAGSKIFVTSRVPITTHGTRYLMEQLSENDAVALFLHFVQPSNIDFGDKEKQKILLQIVKGCKRLPLALEFIGRELQGKGIEELQKVQLEWARGYSILDSNTELLAHLQNSLNLLVDESIRECFMDLGLFPEDQKIPVTALIDMWTELYNLDELGIYAMTFIHKLTALNLAAGIEVKSIVGSVEDNYYNNHFLMQHDLFRELAIHISNQEPFENRKRLIIDMNGNHCPEWWPQQQQQQAITARTLSYFTKWFKDPNQKRVAAPILSISTDQNIAPDWCNIQAADAIVLVLNLKTTEYILPEFTKKMRNLRVLIVTNYGFSPTELKNLRLLESLRTLKRIRLQRVSIPQLSELKSVRKLSLYMCEVKKAFENNSTEFSKAMPNLVDMNIEYCKDLVKLPAGLCNIATLKKLSISSCHKFAELPQEIGKLENLELLRICYCADFIEMPESITKLKNLMVLNISYCVSLRKLPDNIGELRSLRKLYMPGCSIFELPDSMMDMRHLENVICDEGTYDFWETIKSFTHGLDIKKARL